jgi:amino acid adenylation domain-containing protein
MSDEVYELPVSFAQRRIWLLDQFDPAGIAYLVPWRVRLDGPVDRAALAAALDTVVERHETLRTTFRSVDGQPVQVVGPAAGQLSYVDLSGAAEPDAAAEARVAAEATEPIDLARGPLLRATLLRLAPQRHLLVLVTHHVVADGWSFALLFAELAAAYQAWPAGAAPALPELPIQYGDFALWQQERWEAGGFAPDERYWQDELHGAPTTLALPTDFPRPPRQAYRGRTHDLSIPTEVAAGLRGLGQRSGGTLFMTLLSVFATVLARYTGRGDVLVGVPVSGRTRPETEHLVGLFMNTLALRARMDDNPRFVELLDRVRRVTVGGLAHQELPFDRIVEMLHPVRSLAQSPVVQVMFALEEPAEPITTGGLTWTPSLVDNGSAKFDLTLGVTDTGDGLTGRLTYDADLFTPAWAQRFAGCLLAAARAVVADPQTRVGDLELLPAPLRDVVLLDWAAGPPAGPPADVVPLLADALRGERPAVFAVDGTSSRERTARCAGQVAALLARHGVGPDVPVGLCLPRTSALVPALLGVWWAGGGYVPLDPGYPAERLRLMVADSGLRVLLTHSSLAGLVADIAGADVTVLRVDSPEVAQADPVPARVVAPDALAYTIFTSGSTGRPKGVAVPRRAVHAMLCAFRDALPLTEADRLVAVTTLSFDIAVLELLLPLVCGGQVVLADASTAGDGAALRRLLHMSKATALQATPATYRMLHAAGGVPERVRLRLCGGEALPPDLVEVLTADGAQAWNVYGPTETTVWSAAGPVAPPPAPIEVGPPIPGTRMYVLDANLRPVPPGVLGEVYLAGAGVARGYHGQPGLTAERFLPDPWSPGARLYRTGDLARWRDSGRLELLGRADHQVKVRGFRIETGEVEAVLARHAAVAQAVVTAQDTPSGAGSGPGAGPQLVAYVVPAAGSTVDVATLRRHLNGYLPEYMVPAVFVPLPELPLTPNGKVDRGRLPAAVWDAQRSARREPPRTPVEKRLADLWTQLLPPTGELGRHDNFFALGGHSLTATQLIARIGTAFGVQLPLATLFTHATVAELASLLEESGAGRPAGTDTPMDAVSRLSDAEIDDLLRSLIPDESAGREST